jgi:hypothetical protein
MKPHGVTGTVGLSSSRIHSGFITNCFYGRYGQK